MSGARALSPRVKAANASACKSLAEQTLNKLVSVTEISLFMPSPALRRSRLRAAIRPNFDRNRLIDCEVRVTRLMAGDMR
jgi:hypothetical protein